MNRTATEKAMAKVVEKARMWRHLKSLFIAAETQALRDAVDEFEIIFAAYLDSKTSEPGAQS